MDFSFCSSNSAFLINKKLGLEVSVSFKTTITERGPGCLLSFFLPTFSQSGPDEHVKPQVQQPALLDPFFQ